MTYKDREQQKAYQNNWMQNRRLEWIASQGGKCVQCGSTKELEVDHINREEKVTHRVWGFTKEEREKELAKCQVLCHECHKEKTRSEMRKSLVHGTSNGYRKHRCICDECREWNRKDSQIKKARQKARKEAMA